MGKINGTNAKLLEGERILALLVTVDDEGCPHLTVFSAMLEADADTLVWGQYCQGLSKKNIQARPDVGYFILNSKEMRYTRGLAKWTHCATSGPEYERLNDIPRFRYNAYVGYSRAFFMSVESMEDARGFDMQAIGKSKAETARMAQALAPKPDAYQLGSLAKSLVADEALKFLAYMALDGVPRVLPLFQARLASGNRAVFAEEPYADELKSIPEGTPTALYSLLTSAGAGLLFKGTYAREAGLGVLRYDRVYNPNVPMAGYIYPLPPLKTVRAFAGAADV